MLRLRGTPAPARSAQWAATSVRRHGEAALPVALVGSVGLVEPVSAVRLAYAVGAEDVEGGDEHHGAKVRPKADDLRTDSPPRL